MAPAQKKVVLRQFGGELKWGYLPQAGFVSNAGQVEIIDPSGRVSPSEIRDIKSIAYVKDFNLTDAVDPERLGRKTFVTRPRTEGLWVRLGFLDGDSMEGLVHFDTALLDAAATDHGLFVIPPDGRSNTQRLFIPRFALARLELVTAVSREPRRTATPQPIRQGDLFGSPDD